MKRIRRHAYGHEAEMAISEYIAHSMNGNDYGRGQLEEARKTADNVAEAFGRLIQLLADRGMLGAADITHIAHGYDDDTYELVG